MNRQRFDTEIINTQGEAGIYMCVGGEAELLVNGKPFLFERGCIGVISPIIHIQKQSESSDCEFLIITEAIEHIFPAGKKFMDIILDILQHGDAVFRADEPFIDFVLQRQRLITRKRDMLENTKNEREKRLCSSMIYLLVQELMVEVVALAYQYAEVRPMEVDRNTSIAFQFILSLYTNSTHHRSVAFYAKGAGLSVGHFTRIVRKCTQKTPTEWIIFFTIAKSKHLLENTQMSIKEISLALNFPEQFTFRKYFKRHAGIPPKQYRQNQRDKIM